MDGARSTNNGTPATMTRFTVRARTGRILSAGHFRTLVGSAAPGPPAGGPEAFERAAISGRPLEAVRRLLPAVPPLNHREIGRAGLAAELAGEGTVRVRRGRGVREQH